MPEAVTTTTTTPPITTPPPAAAAAALAAVPPPAATPPVTPPAAAPDWTTGLAEDDRGYVTNKGFKTPQDVLTSYRNLEKTFGVPQERLLKLPENLDSPEARAVWERLGAPKEAKDYNLVKDGTDKQLAEWAQGIFHETGIPVKAAEKIIAKWNERATAEQTQSKEKFDSMVTNSEAALKKDWGAAYEQNINLAKQGVKALELTGAEVDGLERTIGRERLFKKLRDIGAGIGEAPFVGGRPAPDAHMGPEQARQKLNEMMQDRGFTTKFIAGDTEAKAQMERLQKMAYPGEIMV